MNASHRKRPVKPSMRIIASLVAWFESSRRMEGLNKPMRCAIYCRVSSDRQREKHTIDSQIRILPEYAKSRGWDLVGQPYIDDGFSGETIEARPAFSRLLDDAAAGKFDVLLVIDDDRISRAKSDMTGAI